MKVYIYSAVAVTIIGVATVLCGAHLKNEADEREKEGWTTKMVSLDPTIYLLTSPDGQQFIVNMRGGMVPYKSGK